MLNSMTGQGQAHGTGPLGTITVEIRTVNNRGLKLSARLTDRLSQFEPKVDSVVRKALSRGSINLNARLQRTGQSSAFTIDRQTISSYYQCLREIDQELDGTSSINLSQLAVLPGVVVESDEDAIDGVQLWGQFEQVLGAALANLNQMRTAEGESMRTSLATDLAKIAEHLSHIESLAPRVVDGYRERLDARISELLESKGLDIAKVDILKEVQLFADRTDISEEITRLHSHLKMFDDTIDAEGASGRRLDFVIQEMFRETNTIGSKANDAEIASHVVDMKCAIERMRELVQNIE